MRAHGVRALIAHGRGEMSLDEAIAVGQGDTRRYARRQFTWFRHQMPGWTWVAPEDASKLVDALLSAGERRNSAPSPGEGRSAGAAFATRIV